MSLPQGTSEIFISLILEMLSVSNNINGFNANIILKVTDEAVTHVLICILDGFCCIGGGIFLFRFINIKQGLLTEGPGSL